MLFELQLSLCERFKCITPFDVRKECFDEVILLVKRLNNRVETQNVDLYNEKHYEKINGKTRVYVPVIE